MKPQQILHEAYCREHAQDAARILEAYPAEEIVGVLQEMPGAVVAGVVSAMNPFVAASILAAMPAPLRTAAVAQLSPAMTARLLLRLDSPLRAVILDALPGSIRDEIAALMAYPPDSAGYFMEPTAFVLIDDSSVKDAVREVRTQAPRTLDELYVIDREHKLVGVLSLRDLLLLDPDERLHAVMRRTLLSIHPMESREQLVDLARSRSAATIPVVDLDQHLLGIVHTEDILQASQEEATADLQTMVGASKDERALSPVWFSVKKRLGWLEINLLTAFLASAVVGLFEDTIARFTALAVLLPVVAGQSGNTGAQSLAVVMRGLALRDIRPRQWLAVGSKELLVALLNGCAVAATTGAAVYLWSRSAGLALVIAISMVVSMGIAGLSGAMIPIALRVMNQDPAQSSSIILTTVTDVVGFFSFLGLATLFSGLLT